MSKLSRGPVFFSCIAIHCLLAGSAFAQAATLIFSQGFEDDASGIRDFTSCERVQSVAAKEGAYVLRGNLIASVVDPITGKNGSGWLLPEIDNLMGSKEARNSAAGTYVSFWLKLDDATWDPESGPGAKLGYFWSDIGSGNEAESIWPVFKFESGWMIGRNSSTGELDARLSENWPVSDLYLNNPDRSFNSNGQWNLVELWFDYRNKNARGYNYFNVWINKNKLTDNSGPFSDGDFDLPADFRLKGWQFFHVNASRIDDSVDGAGHAAGYEIDEIRVWSGRPNAPLPPTLVD